MRYSFSFKVIKENAVQQVKEEVQIQRVCGHFPFIVNCPFYWQSRRRLYIGEVVFLKYIRIIKAFLCLLSKCFKCFLEYNVWSLTASIPRKA